MPTPEANITKPNEPMSELERDVARAKVAAERRMAAPPIAAFGAGSDEREIIVKQAREDGSIPEGTVPFYGDQKEYDTYIGDGYVPVVRKGVQISHGGDPLFYLDKKLADRREGRNAAISQARLADLTEEAKTDGSKADEQTIVKVERIKKEKK